MADLISRRDAIKDAESWVAVDEYEKHLQKNVVEWLKEFPSANVGELIRRQDAIDALWKALYNYEDRTEKQFMESDELDIGDWILHRIFVQNMSDIDRQTILNLPSTQPTIEPRKGKWIPDRINRGWYKCSECHGYAPTLATGVEFLSNYCPYCGADMKGVNNG